jgi:hypothetical protein
MGELQRSQIDLKGMFSNQTNQRLLISAKAQSSTTAPQPSLIVASA